MTTEWRLVPATPTEEMHVAAVKTIVHCTGNADFPPRVWAAMLAVAPRTEPEAVSGLSWNGFNINGDARSVCEVRRLVEFYAAHQADQAWDHSAEELTRRALGNAVTRQINPNAKTVNEL